VLYNISDFFLTITKPDSNGYGSAGSFVAVAGFIKSLTTLPGEIIFKMAVIPTQPGLGDLICASVNPCCKAVRNILGVSPQGD